MTQFGHYHYSLYIIICIFTLTEAKPTLTKENINETELVVSTTSMQEGQRTRNVLVSSLRKKQSILRSSTLPRRSYLCLFQVTEDLCILNPIKHGEVVVPV